MSDDEIWDEDRWEAFLRENDRRVDRFMDVLFGFLSDSPPPDDPAERQAWEARLRAYLRRQGFAPDDDSLPFPPDGPPAGVEPDDDAPEPGTLRHLPVYQQAYRLATDVLDWANALPGHIKDSTLVHFCSHVTQIPANVAKGHGIGLERDMIGGNIACVKRALAAANAALALLFEMKHASYMAPERYRALYEQAYEVRNALGLYVQALRSRFDLGID